MNLLFTMSLSGSIIFILYLLIKPVANRYFTARWQYRFVKICILFYLIPYQLLQNKYFRIYNILFGNKETDSSRGNVSVYKDWNTIYITTDGQVHYLYALPLCIISAVWLGTAIIVLCRQINKYRSCRSKLMILSEISELETLDTQALSGITPQVSGRPDKIAFCSFIKSPVAIGLFRPVIILPTKYNEEDLSLYLSHERSHIRNRDTFWKLLAFITLLIHWYNPLSYLLFREICIASEKNCDEMVTAKLNQSQKMHYADLVIESARNNADPEMLFADTFSVNKKHIKERIMFMSRSEYKLKSPYFKIITALLICIIALSMPISVLAYQPVSVYRDTKDYDPNCDIMYIVFNNQPTPLDFSEKMNMDFSLSDEIIVDEYGNQYAITDDYEQMARSCSHEYIAGQRKKHVRSGDGCTTYIYEGTYCKKCGHCLRESLISQITLTKCTH